MAFPVIFAQLAAGVQPLSDFDTMFGVVGSMGTIFCAATGSNTVALAPITNMPTVSAYSNYQAFGFVATATSTNSVTLNVSSVNALPAYGANGADQLGAGGLTLGTYYLFAYSSVLNSGAGGFQQINANSSGNALVNVQSFTSSGTYTPTAGAVSAVIFGTAGGGGGGGSGTGGSVTAGGNGTATVVGSLLSLNGGAGGGLGQGGGSGQGGAGGTVTTATIKFTGSSGGSAANAGSHAGMGGVGFFGAGAGSYLNGAPGGVGAANTGAGGGAGAGVNGVTTGGGGGGAGASGLAYVPTLSGTYLVTIGAGGSAGVAGGSGFVGGAGGSGLVFVLEF